MEDRLKHIQVFESQSEYDVTEKLFPNVSYVGGVGIVAAKIDPNRQRIIYQTTDDRIMNLSSTEGFGANIISNTYEDGKGIIQFDAEPTTLPYEIFHGKSTLFKITTPKNINKIESIVYYDNANLSEITINSDTDNMDVSSDAFLECPNLHNVINAKHVFFVRRDSEGDFVIADGTKQIHGSAFNGCSGLTSINIPDGVTFIGEGALANCTGVTEFTIPDSVTWLGRSCFANDIFTTISTPANASWDSLLFENCAQLISITVNNVEPPTCDAAFSGCDSLEHIYVRADSVDAYKAADGWSSYADIIETMVNNG